MREKQYIREARKNQESTTMCIYRSGGSKGLKRGRLVESTSNAKSKRIEKPFPKLRVADDQHPLPLV